jgi:hypothetical protein
MPAHSPWETSERGRFRVTFDEDALAYDRVRPVAPAHVFEEPTIHGTSSRSPSPPTTTPSTSRPQSGIKEFPPAARAELISRIRRRVLEGGGSVTAHLLALLTVARLRTASTTRRSCP